MMKDLRLFVSSVLWMREVFRLPQLLVVVDQKSPRSGNGREPCPMDVEDFRKLKKIKKVVLLFFQRFSLVLNFPSKSFCTARLEKWYKKRCEIGGEWLKKPRFAEFGQCFVSQLISPYYRKMFLWDGIADGRLAVRKITKVDHLKILFCGWRKNTQISHPSAERSNNGFTKYGLCCCHFASLIC